MFLHYLLFSVTLTFCRVQLFLSGMPQFIWTLFWANFCMTNFSNTSFLVCEHSSGGRVEFLSLHTRTPVHTLLCCSHIWHIVSLVPVHTLLCYSHIWHIVSLVPVHTLLCYSHICHIVSFVSLHTVSLFGCLCRDVRLSHGWLHFSWTHPCSGFFLFTSRGLIRAQVIKL